MAMSHSLQPQVVHMASALQHSMAPVHMTQHMVAAAAMPSLQQPLDPSTSFTRDDVVVLKQFYDEKGMNRTGAAMAPLMREAALTLRPALEADMVGLEQFVKRIKNWIGNHRRDMKDTVPRASVSKRKLAGARLGSHVTGYTLFNQEYKFEQPAAPPEGWEKRGTVLGLRSRACREAWSMLTADDKAKYSERAKQINANLNPALDKRNRLGDNPLSETQRRKEVAAFHQRLTHHLEALERATGAQAFALLCFEGKVTRSCTEGGKSFLKRFSKIPLERSFRTHCQPHEVFQQSPDNPLMAAGMAAPAAAAMPAPTLVAVGGLGSHLMSHAHAGALSGAHVLAGLPLAGQYSTESYYGQVMHSG